MQQLERYPRPASYGERGAMQHGLVAHTQQAPRWNLYTAREEGGDDSARSAVVEHELAAREECGVRVQHEVQAAVDPGCFHDLGRGGRRGR